MITVGIDVGGTTIKSGVVADDGRVLERHVVATVGDSNSAFLRTLHQGFDGFHEAGLLKDLCGVGVGAFGPLDIDAGTILHTANAPGLDNCPVIEFLSAHIQKLGYNVSCHLNNDGNTAALGQYHFGVARNEQNFAVLTLGTGIGGGCMLSGKLFNGDRGNAFEIGHVPGYHPTDEEFKALPIRQCGCGSLGCLETYASATAVSGYYQLLTEKVCHAHEIAAFAREGDTIARQVYRLAGINLGLALVNLTHTLNLSLYVITGGMAGANDLLSPFIDKTMRERLFPIFRDRVRVVYTEGDEDFGLRGAAALCL